MLWPLYICLLTAASASLCPLSYVALRLTSSAMPPCFLSLSASVWPSCVFLLWMLELSCCHTARIEALSWSCPQLLHVHVPFHDHQMALITSDFCCSAFLWPSNGPNHLGVMCPSGCTVETRQFRRGVDYSLGPDRLVADDSNAPPSGLPADRPRTGEAQGGHWDSRTHGQGRTPFRLFSEHTELLPSKHTEKRRKGGQEPRETERWAGAQKERANAHVGWADLSLGMFSRRWAQA